MHPDNGLRLQYTLVEEWPPLAWLAHCQRAQAEILVFHGGRLETAHDWFCEAIWADSYESGGLDQTDLVFGSGGRIRGGRITFVTSGSTVDRLHSLQLGDHTWVSNSLACLLTAAGGVPDPTYPRYFEDFRSIARGLKKFKRTLATSAGPIHLTYYNNLTWDGTQPTEVDKPSPVRDFSSFSKYRAFLVSSLCRLAENMSSSWRAYPYQMLGTISSGYDSATVVALARHCGLQDAVSFDQARGGTADSGADMARILGVQLSLVSRDAWRSRALSEVPFLASDAKGEDVYFSGAEEQLAGRVVLTGFHGGRIWAKRPRHLSPDIVRADQSGLSLSEYRLWTGFIHCPVPFMGVKQIRDITAISRSAEMAPWDVSRSYSRPICRRILEEAGVPRGVFAVAKKTASVLLFERSSFLSPSSLSDYVLWLTNRSGAWVRKGLRAPRAAGWQGGLFQRVARGTAQLLHALAGLAPRRARLLETIAAKLAVLGRQQLLFFYTFPWAIERAREHYVSRRIATLRKSPDRVPAGET